jgi:hypothetical protein
MAQLRKSPVGSSYIDVIGRKYSVTLKVDPKGRKFLKENANEIYFDKCNKSWQVKNTTLRKALYAEKMNCMLDEIVGNVLFKNKDKTDMRFSNLYTLYD